MSEIYVIKASGDRVLFEQEKLIRSLDKAGAGQDIITEVLNGLNDQLYDGITTRKIYRQAYKILNKLSKRGAGRYKLKEAIFELGPSGYPFEIFVGELLKSQGYKVEVGIIVQGKCVKHEVDVVAENEHNHFIVECKFHSAPNKKSNVVVPLYIHSRFRDIVAAMHQLPGHHTKLHQSWLVTNTRFTTDAIDYGTCSGMNMISWDYPRDTNLSKRVSRSGIHPITSLSCLKKAEKQKLLSLGIVTCHILLDSRKQLVDLGFSEKRVNNVFLQANHLIHNHE
jgi:hypothetical protein